MSKNIKYYVVGEFQGDYKTFQEQPLERFGHVPNDDKHLIKIIRGIIENPQNIDKQVFEKSDSDVLLNDVNNIQINKSLNWPEKHERIFSCDVFKLNNVKFTNVHVINGKTYGTISGNVIASVTDGTYTESEVEQDDFEPKSQKDPWNKNEGKHEKTESVENFNTEIKEGNSPKLFDFLKKLTSFFKKILKWLLIILIILWFLTYTRFGQNIVCGIIKMYYNYQLNGIQREDKRLSDIIDLTKPIRSQCGSQIDFDGDNQERSYTYTLGTTSGELLINYDMFVVPDRLEVMFNGQLVAETKDDSLSLKYKRFESEGFADKKGVLRFNYIYKPNELHELTIRVIPNQEFAITKWQFKVTCP